VATIQRTREHRKAMSTRRTRSILLVLATTTAMVALAAHPAPASAFNPLKPVCGLLGGIPGKICTVVSKPGRVVHAGKKLVTGHPGAALKALAGGTSSGASTALGLAAIVTWVVGGAKFALQETASVLGETTSPQLGTTWFSSAYWRIAEIAALLTLPFLFAAAIQAMLRSDLHLLLRAALGYLPLSLLAVSVAAPLTMLLLAASDQLSALVSSAAGHAGSHFLGHAGLAAGILSLVDRSPFIAFLVGLFTAAGTIVLWLELAMREAAVYVVVLMLPLAFAALVWPARRVWAVRAVELLVALILSKFAIVAVLTLGGAALDQGGGKGVAGMVAGFVLVLMGAFAPWALLRLLPLSELASGAAGSLRGEARAALTPAWETTKGRGSAATGLAESIAARMRPQAAETEASDPAGEGAPSAASSAARRLTAAGAPSAAGSRGAGGASTDRNAGPEADAGRVDARIPDRDQTGSTDPMPEAVTPGTAAAGASAPGSDSAGANGAAAGSDAAAWTPASVAAGAGSRAGDGDPAGAAVDAQPATGGGARERLPGLGPMWQAENGSWRTLTLGPEGRPRKQLWPAEDGEDSAQSARATGDDHDPLPREQDPEQGRL